ncbi:MAG: hypothetical protein U0414_02540 [Polyangiaceae bacterium]
MASVVVGALLGAAVLLGPRVALAGDETDVASARQLGQEGVLAAQAGRCTEAVEKLSRAKALMPVPSILTPLGECQIEIGKLVAGTENLQAAIRYKLGPDAPDAYAKAQAKAKALLPGAQSRLGKLTIIVQAPAGAMPVVEDNGEPVSPALVGVEIPADPGEHAVTVSGKGLRKTTQTVRVPEGGAETATLVVEAAPVPEDPGSKKDPVPTTPPEPRGAGPLVPAGAIMAAVGAAGLVVGGVFGGLSLGTKGRLDDVCDANKGCPPSAAGDIDELQTFSHVSTGSLVAGGVLAGTGGLLLGIGLAKNATAESVAFSPWIGLGWVGVRGRL